MAIADALIPEFDREIATTRRLLERLPGDRLSWRPHAKSMSLGRLSSHLAEVPGWIGSILDGSSFNMEPARYLPFECSTPADVLTAFDRNAAAARATIATKSDAELMAPWTLQRDGHDLFTLPKVAVVRSFLLNHLIHHRGQLSVYLRLNDVPVPSIYGPSADEG